MPRRRTTINFQAQTDALRTKYPDQPHGVVSKRFAVLAMRPRLAGAEDPCPHCQEWRGLVYNPLDAPVLPLVGCAGSTGCRCRYQ